MKQDLVSLIRSHGLQATAQRVAVLGAVTEHPHSSAEEIAAAVRAKIGAISRQAVYDALEVLAGRGLVRRIEPAGAPGLYECRTGDNHHHVICRRCGRVEDVDCAVGFAPCLTPSDAAGFEIDEAEVTYWGLCPACRRGGDAAHRRGRTSSEAGDSERAPAPEAGNSPGRGSSRNELARRKGELQ